VSSIRYKLNYISRPIKGSIPQSLQLHAQVKLVRSRESARIHVCVGQCDSAVDVPVFVCLSSTCSHVTKVGRRCGL
jgi:hypothetical protein